MSLSKPAPNCVFCKLGKGIYNCPRCNQKYCSSFCYKSREHAECSESFYKEWVEQSLQAKASNPENMIQILKKFEEEDTSEISSSIDERFAGIDISSADENVIWGHLSEEEKKGFKEFLKDKKNLASIVTIKQPWWTIKTLNLVSECDAETVSSDGIAERPPYPIDLKTLSEITSTKPSDCIQYNLVNVLYSYTFLSRFYNCELRDFTEEVVNSLFAFSPLLLESINFFTLEESIQESIRIITSSDFDIPLVFVKDIVNDVASLLQGPSNAKSSSFVMCALHDIKLLLMELIYESKQKNTEDKNLRRQLTSAIRKIDYFMSWSLEFESKLLDVASDLVLIMLPDMVSDCKDIMEDKSAPKTLDKPLIEEVE